ncbi:hypothetical protein ACHWQZ_G013038 [Mnemiopsis leidyi]
MRTKGAENTENFAVLPEDPKTNIRRDLIDLLKRAVADNINPQRVLHYITGVIEHQAKNDGYSHSKVVDEEKKGQWTQDTALRNATQHLSTVRMDTVYYHNLFTVDGIPVGTDKAKADIIKEWFTGDEPPLTPFVGPPKPLDVPIKPIEVEFAAKALQNGKANDPDNTPNELLKYAGDSFYQIFATLVNKSFEENKFIDAVGESFITPLAKPGKPPGEEKSLRPLTLCNGARKLLFLITLKRIESKIDLYTGPWQAAYKRGRSCSDLVLSQRIFTSFVMKKQWSFHKMGLDWTCPQHSTLLNNQRSWII